jgi:hypothetical protein
VLFSAIEKAAPEVNTGGLLALFGGSNTTSTQ